MSEETLALKFRPRSFDDIVGQRAVRLVLGKMVQEERVPTGLLFGGVPGTGKTTMARILAAGLNCAEALRPCGSCASCTGIFRATSMDVLEIDAASHGSVADVRKILDTLEYQVTSNHRVVIFDEAHSMSPEAFNTLLKRLEEPPPETIFVLCTSDPTKILKTVLSRLMRFQFGQISVDDITARLQHICLAENVLIEQALLEAIAERANGGLRDAIMTLDQVIRVDVRSLQSFKVLVGEDDFAPAALRALASGDLATAFAIVDKQMSRSGDAVAISSALITTLRDVVVLHAGGELRQQGLAREARKQLTQVIGQDGAMAALKVFWTLKTQVRAGDDPRALLELSVCMAGEQLRGNTARVQVLVQQDAPRKMSFAEIQQLHAADA